MKLPVAALLLPSILSKWCSVCADASFIHHTRRASFAVPSRRTQVSLTTNESSSQIIHEGDYHFQSRGVSDKEAACLALFACAGFFACWMCFNCQPDSRPDGAVAAENEINVNVCTRYLYKYPLAIPVIASLPCILDGVSFSLASGILARLGVESLLRQSLVVGSYQVGQMVSATCLPAFIDAYGRRATLQVVAICQVAAFAMCVFWVYGADDFSLCVLGISRFLAGVFFGQTVAPVYIAELAESSARGTSVSCVEMFTVFGSLLGIVIFALTSDSKLRLVFTLFAILALLNSLLITALPPDSPSRSAEADGPQAQQRSIESKSKAESQSHASLTDKDRRALQIGCVLAFLQQSAGEEAVFGFCLQIAAEAGLGRPLLFGLALGVLVFACNVISSTCGIDAVGRRPVLLVGALGMGFAWATAAISAWQGLGAIFVLACILVYELFSGLSLGPVLFVVVTEVLPDHLRAYGNGLALLVSRVTACVAVLTFNLKNYYISLVGVFVVYSITMLLGAVYIARNVPETMNKTFGEIQDIL